MVQGYHGYFACRDFAGGGSFRARCNFGIARRRLRWREFLEHNETKIYLKYFRVTRRGLKRREFRRTIDRDASLKFRHNKTWQKKHNSHLITRESHVPFYYITRNAFKYNNKNKKIGTTNVTCTVPKQFALPSTIKKQCVLSSIWTKFEYIFPV